MKSLVIVRNIGLVVYGVLVHHEAVTELEAIGYGVTLAAFTWCASSTRANLTKIAMETQPRSSNTMITKTKLCPCKRKFCSQQPI